MIICLCSYENEPPPSPLATRQFVRATKDGLEQFLKDLFRKPGFFPSKKEAINPLLKDKTIEELAIQLSNVLLKHTSDVQYYTNWMELHITDPDKLKVDFIPPNARIEPYKDCLRLFGLVQTPPNKSFWTWNDMIDNGKERECFSNAKAWEKSIAEMLYAAKQGQIFKQSAELFKADNTDDSFRPILTKFMVDSSGTMVFLLIFVKHKDESP